LRFDKDTKRFGAILEVEELLELLGMIGLEELNII
jgi:hypothetical protein